MIVSPDFNWPHFSASSTILRAILSLTEPPALKNSHLATEMIIIRGEWWEGSYSRSSHFSPAVLEILLILTMGVLPILYRTFGIISIFSFLDIKIFDQLRQRGSSTHGLSME